MKNIVARSPFNWAEVQEMMEWGNGEYTEDHHKNAVRMFTHMGDTTMVEKHFQVKSDQCKDPASRKIATSTLWRGPVRQKVLSEVFDYGKEVSVGDIPDDAPAHAELPQSLFRNRYGRGKTSMDFSRLPSRKQKATWQNYSYESWPGLVTESIFLRRCYDLNKFAKAEASWRTQFLRQGLLVREGDGEILVVATYIHPMAVCLPVKRLELGGFVFYDFDFDRDGPLFIFKTVWDFEDWQVMPTDWAAPVHLLRANGWSHFGSFPNAFCYEEPGGGWRKLLTYCAEKGFLDFPEAAVNMLAKREFGMGLNGKFFDTLVGLIPKILKCDDIAAIRRVEHRMAFLDTFTNSYDSVLESDEFYEAVDDDTRKAAVKQVEVSQTFGEKRESMQKEVLARIEKDRKERGAEEPLKKKQKVGKQRANWKKVVASPLPTDEELFTHEYVVSLCPPGTKVNRDIFNGRWQLFWRLAGPPPGPWRSVSRSWGRRMQSECARECLQVVWRWAMAESDIECPVKDLFGPSSSSSASASSGGASASIR